MTKNPKSSTIVETTLYDLISVLSDELETEEEELILPILIDLMNSGRIKFVDGEQHYKISCS
jgi:hypothetical protein